MSFVQRLIGVTITKSQGAFVNSGANTLTITGHRVSCRVESAGAPAGSTMNMRIYGLTLDLMNQLSTLGQIVKLVARDQITVTAGDAVSGMSTVFTGNIVEAYGDFEQAPEVPFVINAFSGGADSVVPIKPTSFKGTTDVTTVMQNLAGQMGYTYEGNGISVKLNNPYYSGSPRSQMIACAAEANVKCAIDKGVLAIWTLTSPRQGDIPVVGPTQGMASYPAFTAQGVLIKVLFNPAIKFGGKVTVQGSSLPVANGTRAVHLLNHELDSLLPGGKWFSTVGLYTFDPANPVLPQQ